MTTYRPFHAVYVEHELLVSISPIAILQGQAPSRVRSMAKGVMMLRTIRSVAPEPNYQLHLTYSDGETIVVDFTPGIQHGGVFALLSDSEFFSQVSIGERGRYIQWPGELDFCADALWLEGHTGESQVFNEQGETAGR